MRFSSVPRTAAVDRAEVATREERTFFAGALRQGAAHFTIVNGLRLDSSEQSVLVDLFILHDHKEILLGIADQVDVGDGVAVD